ncbi:MAG: hypothetical protein ACE5HO_21015 [bacterium]
MKILEATKTGFARVVRAKRYIILVYTVNLIMALILGAAISSSIQSSLKQSVAAENLRNGFDDLWYRSFKANARGLDATFDPSVVGIGAVFNGLDSFLRGNLLKGSSAVLGIGLLYLMMWTFFSAGFISVYTTEDDSPSFFQHAARFFPRFLVLAALAGVVYFLFFNFVQRWLSDAVNSLTRETIDERVHFVFTVAKYAVLMILVWGVNVLFDYSKILTVLQDHKNALTAPIRAMRVVFPHLVKTFGLYLLLGVFWSALVVIYWLVAPGAAQASWIAVLGAFVIGQLYLVSRIGTRCLFYAGQSAMCAALAGAEEPDIPKR